MWKNYLKIAFRNINRNKGYTFLNVAGLAIGIASCLIISFFIRNELGYDNYHKDADRI
jgi:putative ABC transport system permease protein